MPSGPFAHVCMLVRDLDVAVEDWTRILEVLDPGQLERQLVRYDGFGSGDDTGLRWATFVSEHGCEIQLIEPAPGTPLGSRLEKMGEHVHHLCFTVDDVPDAMSRLSDAGVQVLGDGRTHRDPDMDWQEWSWVGPRTAHGVLIEVARPYRSDNDGRWHPVNDC